MKKTTFYTIILTMILLISIVVTASGQYYCGLTLTQIKSDSPNGEISYRSDGNYTYNLTSEYGEWSHLFLKDSEYCFASIFMPYEAYVNTYISIFNDKFVKISPTNWNIYIGDICIDLKLEATESRAIYFVYSICK